MVGYAKGGKDSRKRPYIFGRPNINYQGSQQASPDAIKNAPDVARSVSLDEYDVYAIASYIQYRSEKIAEKPTTAVGDSLLFPEDNRLDVVSARDFGQSFHNIPGINVSYPKAHVVRNLLEGRKKKPVTNGFFDDTAILRKPDGSCCTITLHGFQREEHVHAGDVSYVMWEKTMNEWSVRSMQSDMQRSERGMCDEGFVDEIFSHVTEWMGGA